MGLGDTDLLDDSDGGGRALLVSCSICLEAVTDDGERSWAKLQCGHQFHLDCIGSAFNVKGAMQCPNCRKIEKGQWLYANSCRSFHEFGMDDWANDEDLYDLGYSEVSFGVHWCPFGGLTRLPSSFDERGEISSGAYQDLLGQHAIFAEHTAVSSATHPCPYIAYFGPIHPSSSNSGRNVSDAASFTSHWNGPSVHSEMPTSYAFPAIDVHYNGWEHHSSPFPTTSSHVGSADQSSVASVSQRAARPNPDIQRSGSFMHPFLVGHSTARAGSSIASSVIPPYPSSVVRTRDRVQALQAYSQPPSSSPAMPTSGIPGSRRSSNQRGLSQVGPAAASSDRTAGFYYFPPGGSSVRNFQAVDHHPSARFHAWGREQVPPFSSSEVERDHSWGPFHQAAGGPDTAVRSTSFHQRHGSDRTPSHYRS